MFYDETDIGEIIKQYDIVKVISKSVQLIKIGKKYFGKCPLHNDEAESFMVDPETQKFCCFGCGCGGNVINFIMQYHHTSFLRALKMLDILQRRKLLKALIMIEDLLYFYLEKLLFLFR